VVEQAYADHLLQNTISNLSPQYLYFERPISAKSHGKRLKKTKVKAKEEFKDDWVTVESQNVIDDS